MKHIIYLCAIGVLLFVGGYWLGTSNKTSEVLVPDFLGSSVDPNTFTPPPPFQEADTTTVNLLSKDILRLSYKLDSLSIVKTQHDLAMEKADSKYSRTIDLLNLILAIVAVGGAGIGYYVSRVVNKFDKRLEKITNTESQLNALVEQALTIQKQLPSLVDDYTERIEKAREEIDVTAKSREQAQQDLERLKSKYDVDVTSLEERLRQANNPQLDEINAKMRELERLGGKLTAEDYTNRSFSLNEKGLNISAVAAAESALEIDVDHAQGWLARAFALEDLGLLSETILAYEHYLKLDPNSPGGHFLIGVVLSKNKEEGRAKEMFDRAAALYYERACSRALAGREAFALADLESAIRHDSSYKRMAQNEARLSRLKDNPTFVELVTE